MLRDVKRATAALMMRQRPSKICRPIYACGTGTAKSSPASMRNKLTAYFAVNIGLPEPGRPDG